MTTPNTPSIPLQAVERLTNEWMSALSKEHFSKGKDGAPRVTLTPDEISNLVRHVATPSLHPEGEGLTIPAGMKAWHGQTADEGMEAGPPPADYDGGPVLYRSGHIAPCDDDWSHGEMKRDIIAYTPKPQEGAVPADHPLSRMTAMDEELETQHPGWMAGAVPADGVRRPALPVEAAHLDGCEHTHAPVWLCNCPRPIFLATSPSTTGDGASSGSVERDDIRRNIIRQLGDDPHQDRIILQPTDWDIVLAALSASSPTLDEQGERA